MAQYTDTSGIKFNSVNVDVLPRTKSIGNKDIVDATSEDLIDIAAENGGKLPSTVNAVEIDWNGAEVMTGKPLNTTGEVLSLIRDNIRNVLEFKQYSHANYATTDYVREEINKASSGGSGLSVEDYPSTDTTKIYNLLVAPEGSKYTEIGSLNNGSDWCSNLWAGFEEDGSATLYSDTIVIDNIVCNKNAKIPHTHTNYATTGHSHDLYATQSYVTNKIKEASISGGGSGLDVEEYTDTVNYNLLVAPEGSKYTEIGSLSDGGTWTSQLYATVDNSNNGDTTLYSTYFDGTFIGKFAHSHANYVTVTSFNSRIKNLESRIEYLESYLSYIFDEDTDVPSTPTKPTDIKVNVMGGLYGSGEETTLDETFYMTSYEGEISEDNLKFTLTAVPSNANATFAIKYSKNSDGDVQDTFVNVTTSAITNGLIVNVTPDDLFDDTDWTEYTITATNENGKTSGTLRIEFSYLGDESEVPEIPSLIKYYFYVGQTEPTVSNYTTLGTLLDTYPLTMEYKTTKRDIVYILIADNKSITKVMNGSLTANVSETTSPIAGHKLYKSNTAIASGITLTLYIQ